MNTTTKIAFWLTIAVLIYELNGCKKDKNSNETRVTGTVTEFGNGKPIAGSTVIIQKANVDAMVSYAFSTYLSVKTDANGKYSFTYTNDDKFQYRIAASDFVHFNSDYFSLKKGHNAISIQQYPPSYLKGHFKNINPYDLSDRIDGNGYLNFTFIGSTIDTITYAKLVPGNTTISNTFFVTKNSIQTSFSKNVYCPGFDTTILDINY